MSRYLLLIYLLALTASTNACGYDLLGEQYRIALFDPYLIGDEYSAFFYSTEYLNHAEQATAGRDRQANVRAWAKELGPSVSAQDVMSILYGSSLQHWLAALEDGGLELGWTTNSAWRAISARPDVLEYVLWAKGYESTQTTRLPWEAEPETPTGPYQTDFHQRALAGYTQAAQGSFLRERYAYQLLLLAYYDGDAAAMKTYFDRHFRGTPGILAEWARFHFASQRERPGRFVVEMANAFRYVPEKALPAYNRTPRVIDISTLTIDNKRERANLYAFAALKQHGYALDNLREAHRLDPKNPMLDLLVVREINKLEDWLMTYQLTYMGPALPSQGWPDYSDNYKQDRAAARKANYQKDLAYLKQLRGFLTNYQPISKKPGLGDLMRAQTALLDEDYDQASRLAERLVLTPGPVAMQARIVRYLALLQSGDLQDDAVKNRLAEDLLALESAFAPETKEEKGWRTKEDYIEVGWSPRENRVAALSRAASQAYAETKDTVTAFFLHNRSLGLSLGFGWASAYYQRINFLDRPMSDEVLAEITRIVIADDRSTAFNRLLLSDQVPEVNALRDLAGILELRQNDLAGALAHFSKIPKTWYQEAYQGSFQRHLVSSPINDIIDFQQGPVAFTSKADVVRQLLQLEKVAATTGDAAAAANLLLSKAWFNMSHHGPAWMMLKYGRSSYEPEAATPWPGGGSHTAVPHSVQDYRLIHQNSRALAYLERAEGLASDPEILADIDLNKRTIQWYINQEEAKVDYRISYQEREQKAVEVYRKLMIPFVRDYASTETYQQAIMQCSSLAEL